MDEFLCLLKEMDNDKTSNSIFEPAFTQIEHFCDYVFCIDITAGMAPLINNIKEIITNLYNRAKTYYSKYDNRKLVSLRVRIIAFRDVYLDGKQWLETSDFFILPSQLNELLTFLDTLEAKGGGDKTKSSLEALALAMRTSWVKVNDPNAQRARHIIILCTDAESHSYEESNHQNTENYPHGMPKSYEDLLMEWNGSQPLIRNQEGTLYIDKTAKRLFVFAPEECYPWYDMIEEFEYMCMVSIKKGSGFNGINYKVMLDSMFL